MKGVERVFRRFPEETFDLNKTDYQNNIQVLVAIQEKRKREEIKRLREAGIKINCLENVSLYNLKKLQPLVLNSHEDNYGMFGCFPREILLIIFEDVKSSCYLSKSFFSLWREIKKNMNVRIGEEIDSETQIYDNKSIIEFDISKKNTLNLIRTSKYCDLPLIISKGFYDSYQTEAFYNHCEVKFNFSTIEYSEAVVDELIIRNEWSERLIEDICASEQQTLDNMITCLEKKVPHIADILKNKIRKRGYCRDHW